MAKKQYVDNVRFFNEMCEYRNSVLKAIEEDTELPRINDYIGKTVLDIATRLAYRPNFINYPFREEMISDGVENAIQAINNFDPAKSSNPFSYFTQVIYFAFLRRIEQEKKQLYIKQKVYMNSAISGELYDGAEDTDYLGNIQSSMTTDNMDEFVRNYEEKMEAKKAEKALKKAKGVEMFIEQSENE